MQLLNFQAKNEFVVKIEQLVSVLEEHLNNNCDLKYLEEYLMHIKELLLELNKDCLHAAIETPEIQEDVLDSKSLSRQQLKQKLLIMSKQSKPFNKYEQIKKTILDYLMNVFKKHLYEPTQNYFHEIFFFNDITIQNQIIGTHRAAIHTALNDPHYYLQVRCGV